jgi:hypothetical protein
MSNKSTFTNNSNLPVVLESWYPTMQYMCTMKGITVYPNQTVSIEFAKYGTSLQTIDQVQCISCTGEWYIHNMLINRNDFELWKNNGHTSYGRIGKFWFDVNNSGTYSEYDWADIQRDCNEYSFSLI